MLLQTLFYFSFLKDTLKQKLFTKSCEDFEAYLFHILGSSPLQPGFGISGEEHHESTLEPQKEITESVSNYLAQFVSLKWYILSALHQRPSCPQLSRINSGMDIFRSLALNISLLSPDF